jgi:hypothetical protein
MYTKQSLQNYTMRLLKNVILNPELSNQQFKVEDNNPVFMITGDDICNKIIY